MKEEKFAILDKIKEIRNEENLQITLSIAISNEGNTNYENINQQQMQWILH